MFIQAEIKNAFQTAVHAALTAGALLRENRNHEHQISFKGSINIVTEMDKLAENTIISIIQERFPNHTIVAEESGEINNYSSPFTWFIDPLDGTTNYAHAFPWYAVSIALYNYNLPILGVVYQPEIDELFTAQNTSGAFLNNYKISVSNENQLKKSLVATGFPYNLSENSAKTINQFSNILLNSQGVRRAGSAALDLCAVACGRFEGFWEVGLAPWDTAAGAIILKEAGGQISTLENKPYFPENHTILATNGLIHNKMLSFF